MELAALQLAAAPVRVVVAKLALKQIPLILGVDDNYRKLKSALGSVQFMLEYLETHVGFISIGLSEALKSWIQDVERSSYLAEDLIDEITLELSKRHDNHYLLNNRERQVRGMVLRSPGKLLTPNKINKFKNKMKLIAEEIESLSLFMPKIFPESDPHAIVATNFNWSSSLVDGSVVVGRDNEIRKMVGRLLHEELKVSVIPIVGMGGIGKTTLAQVVYNDSGVHDKFKLKMWVSISANFDVIRIIKSIIQSATKADCTISDLHVLQVKLQDLITWKRFLLVLDDFWSDKHEDWDLLFSPLRDGYKGSKVIVTTRSHKVASIVSNDPACYLEGLNDDLCWKLMKQNAFSNKLEEIRNSKWLMERFVEIRHLEVIGENIAKKCKGLPLAAKTLGSMLNSKPTVQEWNSINESELWALPEGKNGIFQSLALSYYHLPGHLKRCFAYCSIFPPHYEFQVDEMVLLWIAQGFIRPRGKIRLEDIGKEYFMELVWRSFFQLSHDLHVDNCVNHVYKMHDLIYDMAHLVSFATCIRKEFDLSIDEFGHPRHLSLKLKDIKQVMSNTVDWYRRLRTFSLSRVCDTSSEEVKLPDELFKKLKSVRVLTLQNLGISELPGSIKHLKHLRYLKLSEGKMKRLPKEITELCALETLKLEGCKGLLSLPDSFSDLTNLRHLDLGRRSKLTGMPPKLGQLSNIETLSEFIVGNTREDGIAQLEHMQFLRGSICIRNLDNVQSVENAKEAMLDNKPFVETFTLEWRPTNDVGRQQVNILGSLRPHKNVSCLVIRNYSGHSFPDWLGDKLFKLVSVTLESCQNSNTLPFLGQLPLLKCLYIISMPNLVYLDHHFHGDGNGKAFPSLEVLEFKNMTRLSSWQRLKPRDMPRLQKLIFEECPTLSVLPSFRNLHRLKYLDIIFCPRLQMPLPGLRASVKVYYKERRIEIRP